MTKAYRTRGFRVFAALRNTAKAMSLAEIDEIEIVELEVTSVESIRQCADAVTKHTGGTLDMLVNNAGVNAIVPLLDASLDDAKKVYDTKRLEYYCYGASIFAYAYCGQGHNVQYQFGIRRNFFCLGR